MFGKKKEPIQQKNAIRTEPKETVADPKSAPKTPKPEKERKMPSFEFSAFKSFSNIMDGSFLTKDSVLKLIPFFGYLIFLAVVLIANNYVAQRRIKEIDVTSNELKELHDEYISTKSELMYHSKMSEVAKNLELTGVKESMVPPKKVIVIQKAKDNE